VLAFTDLTVGLSERRTLRRELLRWRDLVAALYLDGEPRPAEHAAVFRCLLRFTPGSARQIPLLAATAPSDQAVRRSAKASEPTKQAKAAARNAIGAGNQ
jgi:hypothetical protein